MNRNSSPTSRNALPDFSYSLYTPQTIAALLSRWALSDGATTILEPSCGDGNFLQAIYKHMSLAAQPISLSIEAIEIVPEEAAKAEKMSASLRDIGAKVQVINHDIFSWLGNGNTERRWDAIIGNPPYIRYQYVTASLRFSPSRCYSRGDDCCRGNLS